MEANFKTYTGTKTIKAMPMGKAEAEKVLGKSITPATAGMDGYLVEYPDGYRSWSPKHVFENAYRISETHVDRMKIELADLNERICKATRAISTFGALSEDERWQLKRQLEAMHNYADVLYDRIRCAVEPRSVVSSESPCCCSAGPKKGGE
ncbi:crAss001_48 related protein [Duncaniella muris]|uniref:crAss001_48 related protein n=1 Tax=Duncaniella muris TaxID=2094150 RepID=UPI002674A644|nr:hypothetical protein [Duncaniella muris]